MSDAFREGTIPAKTGFRGKRMRSLSGYKRLSKFVLPVLLGACASSSDIEFHGVDDLMPGQYVTFALPMNQQQTRRLTCNGEHKFEFKETQKSIVVMASDIPVEFELVAYSFNDADSESDTTKRLEEVEAAFEGYSLSSFEFKCIAKDDGGYSGYSYLEVSGKGGRSCFTQEEIEKSASGKAVPTEERNLLFRIYSEQVEVLSPKYRCKSRYLPAKIRSASVSTVHRD